MVKWPPRDMLRKVKKTILYIITGEETDLVKIRRLMITGKLESTMTVEFSSSSEYRT